MKLKTLCIVSFLVVLSFNIAFALSEREIYDAAIKAVRSRNMDFAFMNFRALLIQYPQSQYTEKALFATGEYFFASGDYRDAASLFSRYITEYFDAKGYIFALAYLFKIAEKQGQANLIEKLQKEIVTFRQHSFLFRDFKAYTYRSPFAKDYKVVYYINKVEFLVDDAPFADISY